MDVLDSTNAQVNRALIVIRDQLRAALKPGQYGDWTATLPVHDGRAGRLKCGFSPTIDLTPLAKSAQI